MNEYIIRRADLSDIDALAVLFDQYRIFYQKSSDLAATKQFLFDRFVNFQSIIFTAEAVQSKQLVGFTQLYPIFSSLSMARAVILNDLFVPEEHRKHGIARKLMKAVQQYAIESKLKSIELSTAPDNHKAQALYKSLGYQLDDEFLHYYLNV